MPDPNTSGFRSGRYSALDPDPGRSGGVQLNLAVLPVHACRRAKRLGDGFLGSEPGCKRTQVQFTFSRDEQPGTQPGGPFQLAAEPRNVHHVHSNTDNHGAPPGPLADG